MEEIIKIFSQKRKVEAFNGTPKMAKWEASAGTEGVIPPFHKRLLIYCFARKIKNNVIKVGVISGYERESEIENSKRIVIVSMTSKSH